MPKMANIRKTHKQMMRTLKIPTRDYTRELTIMRIY